MREHRANVAHFSLFLTVLPPRFHPYLLSPLQGPLLLSSYYFLPFSRCTAAQCFVYLSLPIFFFFLSFFPPPFSVHFWSKSDAINQRDYKASSGSGDCSLFWVLRDGEKLCIGRRYRKMKRCSCIIQTPFSHSPLPSQVTTSFDDTCRCSCGFSPADLSFGLTVKFYTPPAREGERGRDSPTLDDCLLATRYACKFIQECETDLSTYWTLREN